MKIMVMSDTHFRKDFFIEKSVMDCILGSDLIIHCGDFTSYEFFNFLESTGKLTAVLGNNDFRLQELLPYEQNISLENYKISVTHGHTCSSETVHLKYTDSDIIIIGHTHHPSVEEFNGKLILNPGSLTWNRYCDMNSFIMLFLENGKRPEARIHYQNKGV